MKLRVISLSFLLFFSSLAYSDLKRETAIEIKASLEKVIKRSGLQSGDLSLAVVDDSKNEIYSLHGDQRLIPASITKLFTTAAVLNAFMPDHQFHTQIYVDGKQEGATLNGNIYLKGGGDPTFVSERLWMLVDEFFRSGIKKITGQIICDDKYFDDESVDPGREVSQSDRAYNASLSALSFNWNSTTLYVRPGLKAGDKATAWIAPENEFIEVKNQVTTSRSGTDIEASRESHGDKDVVILHGKIALGSPEKHIYKNISNPTLVAGGALRNFLKQRGIDISGAVKRGQVPTDARLAADQVGEPLSQIVTGMNKFSNNFIAEMLVKNLAAFKTGQQGKMAEGTNQVRKFIESELKFKSTNYVLDNVSGFTRKNSFSSNQFVDLLAWSVRQFKIFPEMAQSLPIAGIDGTLKERMKGSIAERNVRAKTGSLNNVVSLAGFAGRSDDGLLLFSFIYNGHADESLVRNVFDNLAIALAK